MTWLELGRRLRRSKALARVKPSIARVLAAVDKRGVRWDAYDQVEADKYGGRRSIGVFVWLPGRRAAVTQQGQAHRWFRVHPLARTAREALYAWEFKGSYAKRLEERAAERNPRRRGGRARPTTTPAERRSLRRLRTYLRRLVSLARTDPVLGWDTILKRTSDAVLRARGVVRLFRGVLGEIDGTWRRYEGYKMPFETAVSPAWRALNIIRRTGA